MDAAGDLDMHCFSRAGGRVRAMTGINLKL